MKFLRKLFIKNYEDVNDPKVREKTGILASIGGILINLVLFIFKIIVGVLAFSMSIISDAINNLTDFFSCLLNTLGFKLSAIPADKNHPYGHERIEYITGMIISFIIVAAGIVLGYHAIMSLINQTETPKYDLFALIVLGVSIIFKLLLGLYYRSLGKVIGSESLKASMKDSFNDAICTSGVLIAAIINYYFNNLWWLDPSLSLIISLFIIYSGIKSTHETASPLIGLPPDKDLVKQITNDVLNYNGILGVHDFTCHSYGHTKIFVTLHAEVDGYGNIMEIHDQIDNIESDLAKKYGIELTIHIDPVDTKNEKLPILKKQVSEIVTSIDPNLSIHDLRIVSGPTHSNVLFDVLKSYECTLSDDELAKIIKSKVEALDQTYNVILKIDHKY